MSFSSRSRTSSCSFSRRSTVPRDSPASFSALRADASSARSFSLSVSSCFSRAMSFSILPIQVVENLDRVHVPSFPSASSLPERDPRPRRQGVGQTPHLAIDLVLLERAIGGPKGQPDRGLDRALGHARSLVTVVAGQRLQMREPEPADVGGDLVPRKILRLRNGQVRRDRRKRRIGSETERPRFEGNRVDEQLAGEDGRREARAARARLRRGVPRCRAAGPMASAPWPPRRR